METTINSTQISAKTEKTTLILASQFWNNLEIIVLG